jgi:uncharacterized protein
MQDEYEGEEKVSAKEKEWAAVSHLSSYIGLIFFILVLSYEVLLFLLKVNIILYFLGKGVKLTYEPSLFNLMYLIIPVVINIYIPYYFWKKKKSISPFVEYHCKQSLNFQMSVTLYFIISMAASFIIVGLVLLFILVIFEINSINEAIRKARKGEEYRYPMSINFFR